jgi:hypothetical protein
MLHRFRIVWSISLFILVWSAEALAFPPLNLFRPSDAFLIPEQVPCLPFQFTVGYEGTISARGFQDDHEECNQVGEDCDTDKKVNVLQIYQHKQNALAALKGADAGTKQGQVSQLFNINDESGDQGFLVPTGRFRVPLNLMFAARYYAPYGINFGLFLPVYSMELDHVRWRTKANPTTMEGKLEKNFTELIDEVSSLNLRGWKRTGIGDLLAQVVWTANFPQARPILSNVRVQLRFGISAPTGLKQDEDKILAIPFGNDGSWGVQVAGGLRLTFCRYLHGGIDAEFLSLFGNTRARRVRTDCHQTDLLFLTKVPTFREFGLSQQYNIYVETCNFLKGLSLRINYQFLKRNEDKLFVCNDHIDPFIVNDAESLQDWTAHSLIFGLKYDFKSDLATQKWAPSVLGWFKWGFNGKRAILANTLGVTFTMSF